MQCPGCQGEYSPADHPACPYCGKQVTSGVVKSSTILISAAGTEGVYHSVDDVPDPLRDELMRTTGSLNSATIIIADQRGRAEIAKVLDSLQKEPPSSAIPSYVVHSIGAALLVCSAVLLWLLFR